MMMFTFKNQILLKSNNQIDGCYDQIEIYTNIKFFIF